MRLANLKSPVVRIHSGRMSFDPNTLWSPIIGFIGVTIGFVVARQRDEYKRKLDFCERQLNEFYAPMHARRTEILALSNFRLHVSSVSGAVHGEYAKSMEEMSPSDKGRYSKQLCDTFLTHIPYDNKQLEEVILPLYRDMQRLFMEKLSYADPDTVDYFDTLVGFNESWNRVATMDFQVAEKVIVREEALKPFYEHIRARTEELRGALKTGRLPAKRPRIAPGSKSLGQIYI